MAIRAYTMKSSYINVSLAAVIRDSAVMGAVTLQLGADVLVAWPAWVIGGLAALAVLRFKVSAVWIVVGGAVLGFAFSLVA